MSFLYYFPLHGSKKPQLTLQDVRKSFAADSLWDLLHTPGRFAHGAIAGVMYTGGPDKAVGTMLMCAQSDPDAPDIKLGYYPDQQEWIQIGVKAAEAEYDRLSADEKTKPKQTKDEYVAAECGWLGWYTAPELRPKPVSLRRMWPVSGELVELCDGNQWEAPIVRVSPRKTIETLQLPKTYALNDDGDVETTVKPEFAEFGNLADRIWDHYWGVDGREMDQAEILKSAMRLLNLNYRVSRHEINALKILDDRGIKGILSASNNFKLIEEMLKENEKKESPPAP